MSFITINFIIVLVLASVWQTRTRTVHTYTHRFHIDVSQIITQSTPIRGKAAPFFFSRNQNKCNEIFENGFPTSSHHNELIVYGSTLLFYSNCCGWKWRLIKAHNEHWLYTVCLSVYLSVYSFFFFSYFVKATGNEIKHRDPRFPVTTFNWIRHNATILRKKFLAKKIQYAMFFLSYLTWYSKRWIENSLDL